MSIGIWQVVLILLIVLILFGAGKLPKVMGDVAKGVKNFKSGLKEEDDEEATRPREIAADPAPRHAGEAATALKRDEAAKG
jgi:sec-independent protein translocase protein TatA